jgi:signal transduction histidine kinase
VGLVRQGLASRMDKARDRHDMEEAVERLDSAITELRRFIFNLKPPVWHDRDLATELTRLSSNWRNRTACKRGSTSALTLDGSPTT